MKANANIGSHGARRLRLIVWLQRRPFERYCSEMNDLSQRQRNVLICLCLALATAAVYWPVHHFEFINYDDPDYVYENPHVRGGLTLRGLVWAFTTDYTSQLASVNLAVPHAGLPVVRVERLAHIIWSMCLFHIANTLLLFGVLNRMTRRAWRSAFVAALFALHPLHVESVAWVAERKDVLSAFFWMLTMWAYVRYVETLNAQRSPDHIGAQRSTLSTVWRCCFSRWG